MPLPVQLDIVHRLRDNTDDRQLVRELAAREIIGLRRSLKELQDLAVDTGSKPAPTPRKRKKAPYFRPGTPAKERLLAMIEVDQLSGCWLWLGSGSDNYGYIRDDRGRNKLAHRLSYELHTGYRFKKGEKALHSCDNSWCVNPEHIRPGTNHDNNADKSRRGRHNFAKITLEQAREIRRRNENGESGAALAREFGLSQTTVSQIIHRILWNYDEEDHKKHKRLLKRKEERMSSLTADDVRDIRRRRKRGETQVSIAALYNISQPAVSAIVHRQRWASVR